MKKVSYKVSLGGVISALCLVLMFLTAVFPTLSMTMPLFAGMLITVVAIEVSSSWSLVTYATVAVLAFFVTPDKEAWLFFTFLFGYYPVAKSYFEKMKFKLLGWLCKLAVFNVSIVIIFNLLNAIFGTVELVEEFEFLHEWVIPALLIAGNLIFLLYDYTLTLVTACYLKWFRPTFLRKFK
ncbi:MAG: hypothetical protein NC253_03825 [Ruminococcus sp.]|nr:hypothetical protein [Ruminococcus sp.]MCM1478847.1 hypothetical protein [Muribaculaceae bacterium]